MYRTNRSFGRTLLIGIGMACLVATTGCATGPKSYELKAVADPVINRDAAGRPLSVVVHMYQLKDADEFSKLTLDTLASGRPLPEQLGRDLLEVSEVMLVPGSEQTRNARILEETRHIGIVAFFRQPDPHYWRLLVDAEQVRRKGIDFRVQDCFLSLTSPKPVLIPGQSAAPPLTCPVNEVRTTSAAATPAAAARSAPPAPQSRRSGQMETVRQAAESMLTKKP